MRTVDLSTYAGQAIRLSFRYASPGDAWFWQVDDVVVASDASTCGSAVTFPDFVYDSGTNTVTYTGPLPVSGQQAASVWFEGFEGSWPPADWRVTQSNPNQTWFHGGFAAFEGSYTAAVDYDDQLMDQDEWLMGPQVVLGDLRANTLAFQTMGSPYWCRDGFDNCDLEVWAILGGAVGGGDDILLGLAEDFWSDVFVWSPAHFDLAAAGVPSNVPVAFAFRYQGNDGAQVLIDAVELTGFDPAATATITVRVNGDVGADAFITNTATLAAEHVLSWGTHFETPVEASASSHVGAAALSTSYMEVPRFSQGEAIVYHIHVINSGDALADGVVVTGTLPINTTFAGLDASPPNQAFGYNDSLKQVAWTGNLAPGEHRVLTYAVVPKAGVGIGTVLAVSGGVMSSGVTVPLAGTTILVGEYSLYLPDLVTP
jgi:uncharacterized repeat protein (TIGR01451 family)